LSASKIRQRRALDVHASTRRGASSGDVLRAFAEVADAVRATMKRNAKVLLLADYFRTRPIDEAAIAALFFSAQVFPTHEMTTLQVGGALLSRALQAATGATEEDLSAAYRRHGDFGDAAEEVATAHSRVDGADDLGVVELESELRKIAAARTAAEKSARLEAVLRRSSPRVVKYVLKIITSDLRIGSKEALVEEAIAKAFEATAAEVQRANLLLGDIGGVLRLASEGRLGEAKLRLFHPLGLMLAATAEDSEDAFSTFSDPVVQDKYDGIRAQAHISEKDGKVRLFSRTRDDVTESFPELVGALAALPGELVLDGEVLAYQEPRGALPFSDLQKRIGRKAPTVGQQRAVPVAYVAFDVLYQDGALVMEETQVERAFRLDRIFAGRRAPKAAQVLGQLGLFGGESEMPIGVVLRAPEAHPTSPAELDALFEAAQARGNEGLIIKNPLSAYTPGRRGKSWLKLKRELATLDVVVTGVEFGHGKRAKVLSDYTFAVKDGDQLLDIGKAYNGLTDKEIAEYTRFFFEHTIEDRGWFRKVDPIVVLEIAFNAIMKSERHPSGFALRFPRIVRIRTDKTPADANTLADAQELFERQQRGEVRG
jgi:DNA ligase-1